MHRTVTKDDIRDLLAVFVAAIELDQIRVDALPAKAFRGGYSDSMWRLWRRGHLDYLSLLLSTVDEIQPATLDRLESIVVNCEPEIVGEHFRDLLSGAACGSFPREDVATAALFFERFIKELSHPPEGKPNGLDAKMLMMQWLPITDPLKIADDPECGYKLGVFAAS
ncbi:hypothetical protein JQ582_34925 [Bradyrhizobium japonicum]|uniref:hypothetical protein n=1 Tax=Bradyrhizobium japonicum TaxID=375 RepID=UPI001BACFDB8|nr:hypothetical protein [Bradyrhizobium japonicum]MBR0749135.1 hypothetical protein [Bradyrhizobium japonicum]